MIFSETDLKGAHIVDLKKIEDERGFFARGFCRKEFSDHGLSSDFVQLNVGFSKKKGTLRGLHFQNSPDAEIKLVRCTRGSVFDVIVDLRKESPTNGKWQGFVLTEENHRMIYVPEGFAHGYITLEDDSEIYYFTSNFFAPASARGVRYDDVELGIAWPIEPTVISKADRSWPDLRSAEIQFASL